MRLSTRERSPWLSATTAASLLTVATFAVVLIAVLITTAALCGGDATRVGSGPHPRTRPRERAGADSGGDPDLELPVVEVGKQGEGIVYRLGRRETDSSAGLQQLLEPLARVGGAISVRISHDVPFARSAEAIAACRDAGFATVRIVPRESGR